MANTNTNSLQLIITNNIEEVRALVSEGFCPVECSVGGESIVDELMMDHHGTLSHLESVAIRAYRDHFGARAEDPRFVGVGVADADMAFAVAALAGLLPHPDRDVTGIPPHIAKGLTRDLTALVETVAKVDCNPIGLDIPSMPYGDVLLTWNAMTSQARDTIGGVGAVAMWRNLLEGNPRQLAPFFAAAKTSEEDRRTVSFEDLERCGEEVERVLVLNGSKTFGFPEWYGRDEAGGASDEAKGWKQPVVLALTERFANVTIGCPNQKVAEEIFGPGGLKNVFSQLLPAGWGGREAVGGSPRGEKITEEQLLAAARKVASLILPRPCNCGSGIPWTSCPGEETGPSYCG